MLDTPEDLTRKYQGSYIFHNGISPDNLFFFHRVQADPLRIVLESPEVGELILNFDKQKEIFAAFPPKGIYNVLKDQHYVQFVRYPERQWKRGISMANCRFSSLVHGSHRREVSFNLLKDIFFPKYPKSKEEVKDMLKDKVSIALNKTLGLAKSNDKHYITCGTQFIGECDKDLNNIRIHYEPLRQECIDFFGEDLSWKI